MCIPVIVDANVIHKVLASREDRGGDPILRSWINRGHGTLVYAKTSKFKREMRNEAVRELIIQYRRGQARLIGHAELTNAEERFQCTTIRSNDPHVLALALVTKAMVLCSDDGGLREDFRNINLLPKVGRQKRALYPIDGTKSTRRDFVNQRKCSNREAN